MARIDAADAAGEPVLLVGGGSNLVVADAGWDGVVLLVRTGGLRSTVDGGVAEVDRYQGELDGLWTVEVEFGSLEASRAFSPPDWFGREVTDDQRYRNAALARGRPV